MGPLRPPPQREINLNLKNKTHILVFSFLQSQNKFATGNAIHYNVLTENEHRARKRLLDRVKYNFTRDNNEQELWSSFYPYLAC